MAPVVDNPIADQPADEDAAYTFTVPADAFADPLNTYTTGQMLSVDGGWTAGYGRNF